jgi:hypothetical protein
MDSRTIYTVTLKGAGEIKNNTSLLNGDIKRALTLVDDKSTVADLLRRAAPSLRMTLEGLLQELENGSFIQDKFKMSSGLKIATPKIITPAKSVVDEGEELDFTIVMRAPTPEAMAAEAARHKAEAEARAKQTAEAARIQAEQQAASVRAQIETAKAKADAEARAQAEEKMKQVAEATRLKAEQEAARAKAELEAARAKAEAEARAKQEAEAARIKAEQDAAKARAELEAAKAKAEAEAKARAEAEAKAKQEAEAARIKAEQDAARARAELEAARAKAEAEAEAKARAEAEAKAKREAEAARLKAEQDAAKARAELEAARAKAEAEAKARAEAEAKAKQEAEAARLKAEQDAAKARAELEAARAKAEAEAKARAEAEAKAKQEAEAARLKAEQDAAKARAELEAARAKAEAEAKARAEAEAKAKQEAEAARLKAEQDAAKARAELEAARAKAEAEAKARADAEAKAKQEAEAARLKAEQEAAKARAELEAARAKAEAEAKARADAEAKAKQAAETARLKAEQEAARVKVEFEASMRAEAEAARLKSVKEAEAAHLKAEQDAARMRAELESAKAKEVAEARAEAEAKARLESVRIKAEADDRAAKSATAKAGATGQQSGSPAIELAPIMLGGLDGFAAETQKETGGEAAREEASETPPTLFAEFAVAPEPAQETPQAEVVEQKWPGEADTELKAAAERKAQQEADAARANAMQEMARLKAEAVAKAEMDEAARKMAEEQAKVWAEAEQRAKALAEAQALVQAESGALLSARPEAPAKVAAPVPRKQRKPLPLGKMAAGLFVLLLASVAVLPYLLPMQDYAAKIESILSQQLRQKVQIGSMKAALLPSPKVELKDVSVGEAQELKAGSVVLNFGMGALFSENKPISKAEIGDLALAAASLDKALGWLQAAAGDARYPVAQMVLQRVRVVGEDLNLPTVNGSADIDARGNIAKVALSSEDGKLGIELKPQQSRWQIALNIRESSLPLLPEIQFNELNAKGEAGGSEVSFSDLDGRLYGGMVMGNAKLSWQKGWQLQGRVTVKALELQKALPQFGISGEMDGDASFALNGGKLAQLTRSVGVDGSFVVKKGAINNMDVVETATSNRQGAAGGRTHFDELTGVLQVDSAGQHLRQIKIAAGVMSANGAVDVSPGRQLSGKLSVDLKMRAGLGSVPLTLSGEAGKPSLRVGR